MRYRGVEQVALFAPRDDQARLFGSSLAVPEVVLLPKLARGADELGISQNAVSHHAVLLAVFVPGNVSAEDGDCDRAPQRQEAEAFQGTSRGCQVALPAASTGIAEERGDRQVGVAAVMEDELLQNRHEQRGRRQAQHNAQGGDNAAPEDFCSSFPSHPKSPSCSQPRQGRCRQAPRCRKRRRYTRRNPTRRPHPASAKGF